MDLREETISSEDIYKGSFLSLRKDIVRLPNGKISSRDIVVHPGAVVVVAIDDGGYIPMVRQYRKAVDDTLLELPAGKMEYGEDPGQCALRELAEETGYIADNIRPLTAFYSTPGFSTENMYLFLATGVTKGTSDTDDDEFIEVEHYKLDQLVEMVMAGDIKDSKSIVGILFVARLLNR
ncbi:MAG: ADP-ribose pyrophosphatase [Clostridiales bacterium]|jgi:ADP-ribose pyrophosphatase|nr:ADP-ribose pyrophosphatase [Clostridiales bacterium]MDK2992151.1 ADP-ribose pyrophosphatase [Clostridiales bacterium]